MNFDSSLLNTISTNSYLMLHHTYVLKFLLPTNPKGVLGIVKSWGLFRVLGDFGGAFRVCHPIRPFRVRDLTPNIFFQVSSAWHATF